MKLALTNSSYSCTIKTQTHNRTGAYLKTILQDKKEYIHYFPF